MAGQTYVTDSRQGHYVSIAARFKTQTRLNRLIADVRGMLHGDRFEYVRLVLLSVVVGCLGALGNLGFRRLIDYSSWIFRGLEWNALRIDRGGIFLFLVPVILCSGGLALFALEYFFPGELLGYGFPNFLEMLHLGGGRIKLRRSFLKALGASISLGAGASVGREGPIAQIGGSIGAAVGRITRLSADRCKVLVACGAGAGIAATFNSPIGGLLFAQEIVLLGETELANLTLLIIAATSGSVASGSIAGNDAVFRVQPFVLKSYRELVTYALMGVAMGLLSAGFIRLFCAVAAFFEQLRTSQLVKLLIGLAVVGLIAIPLPENLSDGYPVINNALAGRLSVHHMGLLALAKISASCVSLGCGAPGGVFGPIFFIGAMTGGSFRGLSEALFPGLTGPRGSYALIGLGAFLAGATHAPLTAVFLLFEMTREYYVTLPALLSCVLSLLVARTLETESIDTYALARKGKSLHVGKERRVLSAIPISTVMSTQPIVLSHTDEVIEGLREAGETTQATFPVTDSEGKLVGIIIRRELIKLFTTRDLAGSPLRAYDVARQKPAAVTPESSLDEALQHMHAEDIEELPVVESSNRRLVGLISRHAITSAVRRATASLNALLERDADIFWSSDYHIVLIKVPAASVGKTLGKLYQNAGATILAVQSSSRPDTEFAPHHPDYALKEGDLLVAAGRAATLRALTEELNKPLRTFNKL